MRLGAFGSVVTQTRGVTLNRDLRGEEFIMDLNKLLIAVFGLAMGFAVIGCDTDENCDDAGVCTGDGGEGGAGGEGDAGGIGGEGGGGAAYDTIVIVDTSTDTNAAGTPGADICGVSVECEGTSINATAVSSDPGMSDDICGEGEPNCSADRGDSAAIEDDGSTCEAASSPDSDYMSLGMGGWVSANFGERALNGCTITVVELVGGDEEGYDVYACMGDSDDPANSTDCVMIGASSGGDFSGAIPAE